MGDMLYAVGISICLTMLIVSVDYYEVLTKVIVKQIMIVDTYRTTRNDSWNIDCMILDDVSTFHTHQHFYMC
jgi:hypothetical protein